MCFPSGMMVKGCVTGEAGVSKDGEDRATAGGHATSPVECLNHWQAAHSRSECALAAGASRCGPLLPLWSAAAKTGKC
jgi:hypothetical protein